MLTLNLLPEHSKLEYAFERRKRLIVFVFIALCGITFIFDALLSAVYFYVKEQDRSFAAQLEKQKAAEDSKYIDDLEKSIRDANSEVAALGAIRKDMTASGPVFEKIAKLIRPGVDLKNISLNAVNGDVGINGFAKTREAVLALEEDLKNGDFVVPDSVQSPVTNIFTSQNIHFTFRFKVKNHL